MSVAGSTSAQDVPLREDEIKDTSSANKEGTTLAGSGPQAHARNHAIPPFSQHTRIQRTRIKRGVSEAGTAVEEQKCPQHSKWKWSQSNTSRGNRTKEVRQDDSFLFGCEHIG